MTTLTIRNDDLALLRQAVEFEIEHTNDLIRDMDESDIEAIRVERIRQDRLEAIFASL